MRGGLQEESDLLANEVPAGNDVAPETPCSLERLRAHFTGVCREAAAAHEYEVSRVSIALRLNIWVIRVEMLCLRGLSVALALALVPGPTEALKEGECEGRFVC